jgi:hypothetical protein
MRADQKNLSAPRSDTQLRVQFETSIILKHYALMSPALIGEIFAPELGDQVLADEGEVKRFVAEIAMNMPLPSYQLFALQTLFEAAGDRADYARLRTLTGQADPFNLLDARTRPNHRSLSARFYRYLRRKMAP